MTHLCMLTHTIKYIWNSCFSIYISPFETWTENKIYFIMLTLFRLTSGIPKIDWGVTVTPPPHFLIVLQIFNIWYMFGNINNLQKIKQIFEILNIHCTIKFFSKKCAKTKSGRTMINYTFFEKPLTQRILICKFSKLKGLFKKN